MRLSPSRKTVKENTKRHIYSKLTSGIAHMGEGAWNKKIDELRIYFVTESNGQDAVIQKRLDWFNKNRELQYITSAHIKEERKEELQELVDQLHRLRPSRVSIDIYYSNGDETTKDIVLQNEWVDEDIYLEHMDEAEEVMSIFERHGYEPEYNCYDDHYYIKDMKDYGSDQANSNGEIEYKLIDIEGNTEKRFIIGFTDWHGLDYNLEEAKGLAIKLEKATKCLEELKRKVPEMVR